MPTTRRPPAPTLLTAASSASRPRAMMATSAPELAKRVAMANPIPLLAPVITAVRPARLTSIRDSRKCWHAKETILECAGDSCIGSENGIHRTVPGHHHRHAGRLVRLAHHGAGAVCRPPHRLGPDLPAPPDPRAAAVASNAHRRP